PSAPNVSAACDFCSWVSVLRTPSQINASRTAAIVARMRTAARAEPAGALEGSIKSFMQGTPGRGIVNGGRLRRSTAAMSRELPASISCSADRQDHGSLAADYDLWRV